MADYNIIEKLWNKTDNEELSVYVHTPFCGCECKYCLYTGKLNASETEKKYFAEVLKRSLNRFKDVISKKHVKTLYFGGGTPNAYPLEMLKDVYSTAFKICNAENVILELNPALLTEEKLKEIIEWRMTLITFGVQSFSSSALKKQNRPYIDEKKIKKYIELCHEKGIKVSLDIMCYIDTYTSKDIALFEEDIAKALRTGADFITVYPEVNLIKKDEKMAKEFSDYIKKKIKEGYKGYYIDVAQQQNTEEKCEIRLNPALVYRIINNKYDYETFCNSILPYYENDFGEAIHNIMGFGDKECSQHVVSYSPKKFMYIEHFGYPEPSYDIQYLNPDIDFDI